MVCTSKKSFKREPKQVFVLKQDRACSEPKCVYEYRNTPEFVNELKQLNASYSDIFATNNKSPKRCMGVEHEIIVTEQRPCVDKIRRYPKTSMDMIDSQVKQMLQDGIIRHSSSPYNSNPLLVRKKGDASKRFVVDFRLLNDVTKRDRYPLPNIDDILENCHGSKIFTQLDFASGYWAIPIAEGDKAKTAFSVPRGKFEFERMPFGLVNAQATFQRKIDVVVKKLKEHGYQGIEGYVDNILIHSKTKQEHLKLIKAVYDEIRNHRFTLRADKCQMGFNKLDFLGYCISSNQIQPSPENVEKIVNFPAPNSKKKLQSFLGLVNFSRRFVKQLATITKPLTSMMSDTEDFVWKETHQNAFEKVKYLLASYPILAIPDWNKPFHIELDASEVATGAILYQIDDSGDKRPIYYHSRTLSKTESRWSPTERELFAIVDATRKFKVYCCHEMYIHSDHEALKDIGQQKDPRGKIGRWLLELDALDCTIDYLPGKCNLAADCLSREVISSSPQYNQYEEDADDTMIYALSEVSPLVLKDEQNKDRVLRRVVKDLREKGVIKSGPYKRYSNGMKLNSDGVLLKGCRIVVPSHLQKKIIRDYHSQNHSGTEITAAMIRNRFWFKAISKQTQEHVDQCQVCRQTKRGNDNKAPLITPDVNVRPGEMISIDVATMPESPRNNSCFLVIIDYLSKFNNAIALPHQRASLIKAALWKSWFGIFGIPRKLISDQATNLDGDTVNQLCSELGIEKRHSSPYHLQGNGSAERIIGTIKQRISAMCEDRGLDVSEWDLLLPEAVLMTNNQINKSLKYSPFMCLTGNEGRLPIDNYYNVNEVGDQMPVKTVQADARANRVEAQIAYKKEYDKKAVCRQPLNVGDTVLLKRTFGKYPKLSVKWKHGPYKLTRKVGKVNWLVSNNKGEEKIYHQDLLKLAGVQAEPHFSTQHDHYSLSKPLDNCRKNSKTRVAVIPQMTTYNTAPLKSTLNVQGFRNNVLSNCAGPVPSPLQTNFTSSGRQSVPVIGNRLIDSANQ